MAHAIFNARFDLTSVSATINPDEFDIVGTVNDAEGLFSALDVLVDDLIVLDTAGTESGTVSKYRVISITSQTFTTLTATIKYDDLDLEIDPTGAIGISGFICRPSNYNGLPWMSANDTQGFPQKLITFAQNIISFQKHESGLVQNNIGRYNAGVGGVTKGRAISKSGSTIILADTSTQDKATVIGIALQTQTVGNACYFYKSGRVPSGIITTDCFIENVFPNDSTWVFLSNTSGKLTVQAPLINSGEWETLIGFWDNSSLQIQLNQWGQA